MSIEQGKETQVQALILKKDDPGRGAFVGEHTEYQERRLRQNLPVTVFGTSIHECYMVAIPDGPKFTENSDHYELEALKLLGFSPRIVDQDELSKIAQQQG